MQILHELVEKSVRLKYIHYNMRRSKGIRRDLVKTEDGLTYKRGDVKYLKLIENMHLALFRKPLLPWLSWLYRFRAKELISVVVDSNDNLIGYDLFFFEPAEANLKVIHELYVGVAHQFQDRGIGVKLRQYSASCYDDGYLDGISTLAAYDNIKALRTAQKAGFAITKESAKPPAYYLYRHLTRRY
ncbi:MAG: GNAT family N-acetyltransferase [Succinivibrio sp.]